MIHDHTTRNTMKEIEVDYFDRELQLKAADAPYACGDDGERHVMFHHVPILVSRRLHDCSIDQIIVLRQENI